MNLDSIYASADTQPTLIAAGITAVIILSGMVLLAIDIFRSPDRQLPSQVYGWLIVAGIFVAMTTVALYMGASTSAIKAENGNFQDGLQRTYGVTSTATLHQVDEGTSVVVSGSRGNELVTLRKTKDQILVFRTDGTELPRVSQ